jgi:hypothetical protein
MNLFKQMAKSMIESANGKIQFFPNCYIFGDKGTTNNSGVFIKPVPSRDGRMMSLALNVRAVLNCPQPPGDFPGMPNKLSHCVPAKACRDCPHHITRRRGANYPCCAILRNIRHSGPTLTQLAESATEKAVKELS